jgi:hypothetical protein
LQTVREEEIIMTPVYQLIMRQGPTPGLIYDLVKPEVSIGRDMTNDFVVNDAEVSRRHAVLRLAGGSYVIEDLGSTNGTFINGQRLIGPHSLSVGEVITLGELVMVVFDAARPDLAATMMGTNVGAQPPVPPVYATPMQQPAAQPVFVVPPAPPASVNAAPPDYRLEEAPIEAPGRKSNQGLWVLAGCGCLVLLAIACATAVLALDYYGLWCTLFGAVIPGC